MTTTKSVLLAKDKKQTWLIEQLRDAGIKTTPSELSSVLNGYLETPKAKRILAASDEILSKV